MVTPTMRALNVGEILRRASWPSGVIVLSLCAGTFVADAWLVRLAFAGAVAACVAAAGLRAPRSLVTALVLWVVPLALMRRLLNSTNAGGGAPDPLLLVLPFMLMIALVAASWRGCFERLTGLAKTVLALSALVLLATLNPLQGSLLTGVSSLIFYVPLLAFWVGRSVVDDALLKRVATLVSVLAVPAALYGISQVLSGLPSWDQRWVDSLGQTSLAVNGALRPFSVFSSSAEFGMFLAIATALWIIMRPLRFPLAVRVGIAALLVTAIVLASSRGLLVVLVVTAGVIVGARRRLPMLPTIVVGVLLVLTLPVLASRLAPSTYGQSSASILVRHQLEGLSNPLDPSTSTLGIHASLMFHGISSAFHRPAGLGAGSVTIAGQKFGGVAAGTEADPSNAAVAFGLPGLILYLVLLILALRTVYAVAVRRSDALGFAALAIVVLTVLQWMNGGQYAVTFLPWLVLGWADRAQLELRTRKSVDVPLGPRPIE